MQYLCNRTFVGLPMRIFESVGSESIFLKPIRNPSVFGSVSKMMLPIRSDGHPTFHKHKWKNCKISKRVDSSWNNWLFIVFFLIFMRLIFNFFLFNQSIFHFLCCHVNDGCVNKGHYDAYTTDGFHRALTNSASTRLLSAINKKVSSSWLFWQAKGS